MGALPKSLLGMGAMVKAYHGTPHKVDKFRMDKIGTGEGAQAYGHGLYFAENPKVAGQYKDAGGVPDFDANNPDSWIAWMKSSKVPDSDISDIMKESGYKGDAVKAVKRADLNQGNLYNVDLDVNHEDLLDWDAPLSEQSEKVKELAKQFNITTTPSGMKEARGSDIYRAVSNAKSKPPYNTSTMNPGEAEGSKYLKELGIPGIRYLDAGSRGSKEGTRNLVMFDEDLIKIADDFKFPDELKSLKGEPVNKINEMRATTKANPVTVYHSTGEQFDKFDPEKGIGGQMWFTSRKDLAEQGYDGAVSKGRLVEAELDIRNPASWAEYDKYGTDELLGMGYDGVKLEQNGEDVYIALFPEQIRVKSNK